MTPYGMYWAMAFAVTLAVETPVYAALIGKPYLRSASIGAGASVLTHPILWFVVTPNVPWNPTSWALSEAAIILVEALWLWAWGVHERRLPRLLAIALAANGASVVVGELLRPVLPYL